MFEGSCPSEPTWTAKNVPDLTGKVAVVTGSNAGIGKETCKELLAHGAKVYLCARDEGKAQNAIDDLVKATGKEDIHFLKLDLGTVEAARSAALELISKEQAIHILILNAGVMDPPKGSKTLDGKYELQWGTNVVCHFAFFYTLLPTLVQTSKTSTPGTVRVVSITSNGHRFAPDGGINFENPNKYDSYTAYGQSKLGNVLIAKELVRRHAADGILAYAVHPGHIRTELNRHQPNFAAKIVEKVMLHPIEFGAISSLYAATSYEVTKDPAFNGGYIVPWAKHAEPSKYARDPELAKKLWTYLVEEIGAEPYGEK